MAENDLIEKMIQEGALKRGPKDPEDYCRVPISDSPELALTSIVVKKDILLGLAEGSVDEITTNIHHQIDSVSLDGGETIDCKFYNGTARITYDLEKRIFNTSISGLTYWKICNGGK